LADETKDTDAAKKVKLEAAVAKEDLDKAESKLQKKQQKVHDAKSKVVKATKVIEEATEEIKAKVADDKEVKKNELSADGKLKTFTREKPQHTKEFEEAKAYVTHVEDKHDEQRQVVTTPTLKGEWVSEETKEE